MFIFIASLFSFSCKVENNKSLSIPTQSEVFGIASPISLGIDETIIYLEDFFTDASKVDSIVCDKNLSLEMLPDSSKISLKVKSDSLPKLSVLSVFAHGYKYSLLLKKSSKVKQTFIFDPQGKTYSNVNVKGEMNAWNAASAPLTFDGKVWTIDMISEPGKYQYKFVVDGVEMLDPSNSDSVSNNIGGFNSLVQIGEVNDDKVPYLFSVSYTNDSVKIGFENNVKEVVVFWGNYELPAKYFSKNKKGLTLKIPVQAADFDRSYIRVWASNEWGFSNDIKIPLQKGKVISDASELTRFDFEAATIYNVFMDRFFDGNTQNNRPINDPTVVLPPADYHGGDIAGLLQILNNGYFDTLGINTVWISPIVKNVEGAYGQWNNPNTKFSAYHGYWPISLTQIDDRFGSADEFKNLVNNLHDNNKNILVDFVAHHVHETAQIIKEHPDWQTDLYLPDGTLNTEKWDEHRLTTWFDVFLPTLDNRKSEVVEVVTDSALYWLNEYGIDGFRHDAAKHVPLKFWRALTYKIKREVEIVSNQKLYQIGETYGSHELVGSYVNSGMLDAQFDFNLYDAIAPSLAIGNSFKNVGNAMKKSFKFYGYHHLMGNISGNQDRGRFISYATGTLRFDEDAKLAGWTRDISVGDSTGYLKSAMLFAFNNTIPGIPVIYYGDEIGMPGGNDPDNRRMMRFDDLNNDELTLKQTVGKLVKLRRSSMALIFGDFKFLLVEDDVMAYQRTYFDKTVIVVFNNSSDTKYVTVPMSKNANNQNLEAQFNCCFSESNNELGFEMSPFSFEIFMN